MTRIIAGLAGGRGLTVPPRGTRPTSDRVREALFSRLEHLDVVDGARVADLYAGSGALGLEAASRGAAHVVLVESAGPAVAVCRRNVAALGLAGVRVVADRVLPWLQRGDETFDLVLLDPPYDLADAALGDVLVALVPHLDPQGVVVVERSTRSGRPPWPATWRELDERRYGETTVWFAEPEVSEDAAT
ncbi:16S rRNA (guanine(966)-N(2))-methyltransferase RsmD [Actinotalea sp. M2MS4P-6]|uniref:16S rRNA (guanine(966)-N(2))-methyltransferase RsmD n=1 Tax=Actinotalea sp. M2MS4P-6 TaxID=2983762 RepID=UPI0021E36F4C|nr:16S rRNA (guanine(966)-N(2))-methyltransferase RsmD [Actinotalea sp. M2MS4P-6]MCV2393983.1 16S rRNA (guanine(966)-N(2))-methyltransferase RsmD [Actinotalea sp. M2MS4P-6]